MEKTDREGKERAKERKKRKEGGTRKRKIDRR